MSSLLPLIVLSIALLHCAQADPTKKCRVGADILSSTGVSDGVAALTLGEKDCPNGKCSLMVHRKLDGYSIHYDCETAPPTISKPHGCKRETDLTCFCVPSSGSICNVPDHMFDPNIDDVHKIRVQLASEMGFIAQPADIAGKVVFKMVDLICEKWIVTFDYKGDVAVRSDNVEKSNVSCAASLCYTKATHDTNLQKFKIESGCYKIDRPLVDPYDYVEEDNTLTVYCLANTENPCNTLQLMFDPNGDEDQKGRAHVLKTEVTLAVQSSIVEGKKLVDFKWSNCMDWNYDQTASGQSNQNKQTIRCKSGVCTSKLARLDKKISVKTGCGDELPRLIETECKTILEEETSTCRCPADKEPCNTISALYNPTSSMKGQKKRLHNLQYIGINVTFDSAGEDKFKYEEDFGKTTTEATITVSGETTVPLPSTARPPSQLPEDDPYYEELLGSATGLSLTFAVLFSLLRLI